MSWRISNLMLRQLRGPEPCSEGDAAVPSFSCWVWSVGVLWWTEGSIRGFDSSGVLNPKVNNKSKLLKDGLYISFWNPFTVSKDEPIIICEWMPHHETETYHSNLSIPANLPLWNQVQQQNRIKHQIRSEPTRKNCNVYRLRGRAFFSCFESIWWKNEPPGTRCTLCWMKK